MAEWIPPKIDYWDTPRPVGGEDFKRIEGNTAYIKEQIDGLKSGSIKAGDASKLGGVVADAFDIFYEPSNDVILNMPTYDYIHGAYQKLTKRFQVAHTGQYKIVAQIRAGGPTGDVLVTIQTSPSNVVAQFDSIIRDDAWRTYELIFQGISGQEYLMYLKKTTQAGTLYIQNVKLCGRPRTARPVFKIISQATP